MTKDIVVVCVTDQLQCDRLIRKGREVANRHHCRLEVISVQPKDRSAARNAQILEYLFNCARQVDAEMRVYYADDPVHEVAGWIRRHPVLMTLVGKPGKESNGFVRRLMEELPEHMVEQPDLLDDIFSMDVQNYPA